MNMIAGQDNYKFLEIFEFRKRQKGRMSKSELDLKEKIDDLWTVYQAIEHGVGEKLREIRMIHDAHSFSEEVEQELHHRKMDALLELQRGHERIEKLIAWLEENKRFRFLGDYDKIDYSLELLEESARDCAKRIESISTDLRDKIDDDLTEHPKKKKGMFRFLSMMGLWALVLTLFIQFAV